MLQRSVKLEMFADLFTYIKSFGLVISAVKLKRAVCINFQRLSSGLFTYASEISCQFSYSISFSSEKSNIFSTIAQNEPDLAGLLPWSRRRAGVFLWNFITFLCHF